MANSNNNPVIATLIMALLCLVCFVQADFEASAIRSMNADVSQTSLFGSGEGGGGPLSGLFGGSNQSGGGVLGDLLGGGGNSSGSGGLTAPSEDLSGQAERTITSNETVGNFSTYSSSSLGIRFLSPTPWLNMSQLVGNFGANIQFISPPDDQNGFQAAITVSIVQLLNTTSPLEEYARTNDLILNATAMNYDVIESQDAVLADSPSIRKVFTMTAEFPNGNGTITTVNLKGIQMYGIQGSKAYTISLIAEESNYDTFLPVFQTVSDSFEVTSQEFNVEPIDYAPNLLQKYPSENSKQGSQLPNIVYVSPSAREIGELPTPQERSQAINDFRLKVTLTAGIVNAAVTTLRAVANVEVTKFMFPSFSFGPSRGPLIPGLASNRLASGALQAFAFGFTLTSAYYIYKAGDIYDDQLLHSLYTQEFGGMVGISESVIDATMRDLLENDRIRYPFDTLPS